MRRGFTVVALLLLVSLTAVAGRRSDIKLVFLEPSFSRILLVSTSQSQQPAASDTSSAPTATEKSKSDQTAKTPENRKRIRIGVTQVASTVESTFSTDGLQQELINDLNFLGAQGIGISTDPHDREGVLEQAKLQGCDYVLFTTINGLKTASVGQKLGSVFNRGGLGAVGGSGQGRVELNAQVKVFQPDGATPLFDGDVNFRQNDAEGTAKGLMKTEARNAMLQIRKLQNLK